MDDTTERGPCIDHGIQGCEDCGHWQAAVDVRDDAYERRIADLTAERAADCRVLEHQAESIAALTVERDALKCERDADAARWSTALDKAIKALGTATAERDEAVRERDAATEVLTFITDSRDHWRRLAEAADGNVSTLLETIEEFARGYGGHGQDPWTDGLLRTAAEIRKATAAKATT